MVIMPVVPFVAVPPPVCTLKKRKRQFDLEGTSCHCEEIITQMRLNGQSVITHTLTF